MSSNQAILLFAGIIAIIVIHENVVKEHNKWFNRLDKPPGRD